MIVVMLVHVITIMVHVNAYHIEVVYHVKKSYVQCFLNYVRHVVRYNVFLVFPGII